VPYVRRLPPEDQAELMGHVQVLLHEKNFEGCGGLQVTDEIKVTIAAQAAVLLLHRETDYFPRLTTILVYPAAYWANARRQEPGGITVEGPEARAGESWRADTVVLSWDDVRKGASDIHDGHNVVFHEFAHQIDGESGGTEGAPDLGSRSRYVAWARVLGHEFETLREEIRKDHATLLDRYGATNPAEFFAVATECFFERPRALKRLHPELYDQLAGFFRQDPATRDEG
jgi:Mlc titration factor MtfA (ptsG expression regulator)